MKQDRILSDHGSGGKASHQMIRDILLPFFDNPVLCRMNDGAMLEMGGGQIAFSTDSYTVDPLFFPGGDIGDLAINGTVNDIAMCGAEPRYLSLGLILEEGFPMDDFRRILLSMKTAAQKAGVEIVTGDTKVVQKGAADKIFINTTGIGKVYDDVHIGGERAEIGDCVLLSGSMADHGMTVLTMREGLSFDSGLRSDTAPLNHMVREMLTATNEIHVLRDPTRGGVGTSLNEIAGQSGKGILIFEDRLPVKKDVMGVCDFLGFDPLYVANEGKLLAFVPARHADAVLSRMRENEFGKDACIIGEVVSDHPGKVFMKTRIGGIRIVGMLAGEQLPRIC